MSNKRQRLKQKKPQVLDIQNNKPKTSTDAICAQQDIYIKTINNNIAGHDNSETMNVKTIENIEQEPEDESKENDACNLEIEPVTEQYSETNKLPKDNREIQSLPKINWDEIANLEKNQLSEITNPTENKHFTSTNHETNLFQSILIMIGIAATIISIIIVLL